MGQARGNITIDIEECKGCGLCVESCPPKCLELAAELSGFGVHPGALHGRRLHRMRNLFLLLSRAGSDHHLSAGAAQDGGSAGRRSCDSFVKEM